MTDLNLTISAITLNVNGLNTPLKRQTLTDWMKMQNPTVCCLQEINFKQRKTIRLKEK